MALSIDHKPGNPNERKRILKAGANINVRDDYLYMGPSFLAMSRSMIDFEYKRNEKLSMFDQAVSPSADVVHRTIDDTWEFLILACDGIWDVLSNEEAINFVLHRIAEGKSPGKYLV